VHHLTYERLGNEHLSDVIVLCLACHGKEHPHHDFADRRTQRQRARAKRRKTGRKWDAQKREARNALGRRARREKGINRAFGDRP
jgi:hypothetical protein